MGKSRAPTIGGGTQTTISASTSVVRATWSSLRGELGGAQIFGSRLAGLAVCNDVERYSLALVGPSINNLETWQPIATAPVERELKVRLQDSVGRYALLFPCRLIPGQGWINSWLETPLAADPVGLAELGSAVYRLLIQTRCAPVGNVEAVNGIMPPA